MTINHKTLNLEFSPFQGLDAYRVLSSLGLGSFKAWDLGFRL